MYKCKLILFLYEASASFGVSNCDVRGKMVVNGVAIESKMCR